MYVEKWSNEEGSKPSWIKVSTCTDVVDNAVPMPFTLGPTQKQRIQEKARLCKIKQYCDIGLSEYAKENPKIIMLLTPNEIHNYTDKANLICQKRRNVPYMPSRFLREKSDTAQLM